MAHRTQAAHCVGSHALDSAESMYVAYPQAVHLVKGERAPGTRRASEHSRQHRPEQGHGVYTGGCHHALGDKSVR